MSDTVQKVEEFFSSYPVREYRKGQVLILNGETPDSVHYLVSGTVKQYDVSYRGEEIVLNMFKPGAFFPMSFALNGGNSNYIFEAAEDIKLRSCPSEQAVSFLHDNPDVMLDLMARVYRGTDALLGRIVQLVDGNARSRLLYELVVAVKRFGKLSADNSYELKISEKDLASRSGLSRETVSREMKKLKQQGLADIDNGRITIRSLSALQEELE